MSRGTLLLTGATGQLGQALLKSFGRGRPVVQQALHARDGVLGVDLSDARATREMLDRIRPDTIVHCAALADVDACERRPADAYALNVKATQTLAEWILEKRPAARLVYISTDQVYDTPGPSGEDQTCPRNIYALTKLWGEDHGRRVPQNSVLRVNFFSGDQANSKNLISWLLARTHGQGTVTLFRDILYNPLHVDHLAPLIMEFADRGIIGTFNLGSSEEGMSKAAFFRAAAARLKLSEQNFRDGSVDDANLMAYRPRDMRMNVSKAEKALGRRLPTTAMGLDLLAAEYIPAK